MWDLRVEFLNCGWGFIFYGGSEKVPVAVLLSLVVILSNTVPKVCTFLSCILLFVLIICFFFFCAV